MSEISAILDDDVDLARVSPKFEHAQAARSCGSDVTLDLTIPSAHKEHAGQLTVIQTSYVPRRDPTLDGCNERLLLYVYHVYDLLFFQLLEREKKALRLRHADDIIGLRLVGSEVNLATEL